MPRRRTSTSAAPAAPTGRRTRRTNNRAPLPFARRLVLHQWVLGLFGVERFEALAEHLRDDKLEGPDENNIHRFHHALVLHLPPEQRRHSNDQLCLVPSQCAFAASATGAEPGDRSRGDGTGARRRGGSSGAQ